MACFSVARAVLVRLLFAVHGVVSIWRLATVTDDVRYWYLASVLGLYLFEMSITLGKKRGKEWKWFCPSVFIYLMCVVPAIWFLELYEMDKRIEAFDAMHEYRNVSELAKEWIMEERQENATKEDLHASLGTVLGVSG
ncbi:hypothetical protein BaRGS_00011975 [Batillaria attramentaria]|uniref:Uncharacterized protein n=1 Tax=Batillaria attramentaria TaxID=370345 RepID=A0ABD0LB32_9CAEN